MNFSDENLKWYTLLSGALTVNSIAEAIAFHTWFLTFGGAIITCGLSVPMLYRMYIHKKEAAIVALKKAEEQRIKTEENNVSKAAKEFKASIQKSFDNVFKGTDKEEIFDQKVFAMIDFMDDLIKDKFNGLLRIRISEILNSSLSLYVTNLKAAEKMIKATNANLDFSDDINILMNQNKEIIQKMNEMLREIIMVDITKVPFDDLIEEYTRAIINIQKMKDLK